MKFSHTNQRRTRVHKVVKNPYTGELKKIYGHSYQELNQNIENQISRWEKQKERKENEEHIFQLTQKTAKLNLELNNKITLLKSIISDNEYKNVDIKKYYQHQYKKDEFPKFIPSDPPSKIRIGIELRVPKENKFVEFFFRKEKRIRLDKEAEVENLFKLRTKEYEKNEAQRKSDYDIEYQKHLEAIKQHNDTINARQDAFFNLESNEIEQLAEHFIRLIHNFDCEIKFDTSTKKFFVSLIFPEQDHIPIIKEYRLIKSRKEIREMKLTKREHSLFHESVIFQMALKTAHDLFAIFDFSKTVSITGYMNTVDPKTGMSKSAIVLLMDESRESYEKSNLSNVELKECVEGLGASFNNKFTPLKQKIVSEKSKKKNSVLYKNSVESNTVLIQTPDSSSPTSNQMVDDQNPVFNLIEESSVQNETAPIDDLMSMFFQS